MNPFENKNIILGITGSIAAYKAADLASKLTQAGAHVIPVLTSAAVKFISPLSLQTVTGNRAYTDENLWGNEAHVLHIGLGRQADFILVAPASANTMGKLAHGLADNLLTLSILAASPETPVVIAPAMDAGMFSHPSTHANVEILENRGVTFIGPEEGHLASGLNAKGRMTEPEDILQQVRYKLSRGNPLSGTRFLVTAGATKEAIDPVRYISNPSTGKQGVAFAQAAQDAGADGTLISPELHVGIPFGVNQITIRTAEEMLNEVMGNLETHDVLIMTAAVADFRPSETASRKIKKEKGKDSIPITRTEDILRHVSQFREEHQTPKIVIGFAAETDDLIENATKKIVEKKLDWIIANDISAQEAGFASDTNIVTLIDQQGAVESLPKMSKLQLAKLMIDKITKQLSG